MGTPSHRVLIVEDYAPFRRLISSILTNHSEFEIVEVDDGLKAVEMACKLRPDLMLLDIGLPSLNGIDAARRIRKLFPEAKIIFLSQESSAEVVQEALALGALGYVVKVHAATELIPAVEAALGGNQFVGKGISVREPASSAEPEAPAQDREERPASFATRPRAEMRCHKVEFYSEEAAFVAGFVRFIESGLRAGSAVVTVAMQAHRESILQRLLEHGVDVASAVERGRYLSIDMSDALSAVMHGDQVDPTRFQTFIREMVARAAEASDAACPRVAICGEGAAHLCAEGKGEAAVEIEHLSDEIARGCDVEILCGYLVSCAQRERESDIYERICAEHSEVCFL